MASIIPFLDEAAFEPKDITAMSMALDDVCKMMGLPERDLRGRRTVATRIIERRAQPDQA
jgi:hypothetical protein